METKVNDKVSMFKDYDEVMKRIIDQEKKEVAELQRQKGLLVLSNRDLEDDLTRKRGQFEQWKRLEEQKLTEVKNKLNNEVIRREKSLEMGELDMSRRSEEMSRREEIGKQLLTRESKLNNDRLEVEKLRVSASLLMENANKKMSEASSLYSQATIADQKSKEALNKSNRINDEVLKREHAIVEREKELALQSKNVEELRKIIDPKLAEIKTIEDNIDIERKQLAKREESVNAQIIEERTILKDLDLKEKKLLEREKQLNQKDEEITRKGLMIGVKSA